MKSLLIVATLALSSNAFSGDTLIKISSVNHMMMNFSSDLTVHETGKVELVQRHGSAITKSELNSLSPNTIQSIKDNIDAVNANDKLVDLDAKKPRCMDAPFHEISIMKNGKEVEIGNFSLCHRNQMKSKAATDLIKLIETIDSKK